jgi:CheY-like chemotaxis protein
MRQFTAGFIKGDIQMKKILICEDEQDAQASLKSLLAKRNYDVLGVNNGRDAIDQARAFQPDLILLDIRMPKIDGLEVASSIREFDENVKIIFLTAFDSPEMKKEASRQDISGYLTKPVSTDTIIKTIESALQ